MEGGDRGREGVREGGREGGRGGEGRETHRSSHLIHCLFLRSCCSCLVSPAHEVVKVNREATITPCGWRRLQKEMALFTTETRNAICTHSECWVHEKPSVMSVHGSTALP